MVNLRLILLYAVTVFLAETCSIYLCMTFKWSLIICQIYETFDRAQSNVGGVEVEGTEGRL